VRPFDLICDAEDERVAPYRDLRAGDSVLRRHGFIAEGRVVLARAAGHGLHPLRSVLVADRLQDVIGPLLEPLGPEVERLAAPQAVMDRICGFPVHRGVLAYGQRSALPSPAEALARLAPDALVVCAVGVGDPENMGAIFRNAAAFGARAIILDATCCDPLCRRAIRVSVGASLTIPHARLAPGEDLLGELERHGMEALALSPGGALALKAVSRAGPVALIVGAEGPGLPLDLLARCRTVRIPMTNGFDSLNVATALAVALHHLS
jgi:tRNA G18 (ribose-2'-O)-methylase SpoU